MNIADDNAYVKTKHKYRALINMHGGAIEYEAKFLDIDAKKVKAKLKDIGAKRIHKRFKMIRSAFELCNNMNGFARVRSEYKKTTMTVKIKKSDKFFDEYEVSIPEGFEAGETFLISLGLKKKAYQESYREKFIVPGYKGVHEIVFDDLPGLPTYMEIDCVDEESLNEMISLLELDKTKMRYGSFGLTYLEYYGIDTNVINYVPFLTFKNIENEISPTKNEKLLHKIAKHQKEW